MGEYDVARNVDEALNILDSKEEKHPEKRYKAAFNAYSEKRDM